MLRWCLCGALFGGALLAVACSDSSSSSSTTGPSSSLYNIAIDTTTTRDSTKASVGGTIPIRVQVTQNGAAVPAVTVTWSVGAGHGTLSTPTSSTDSAGYASVEWTLGDTLGLNSLTAVAGGNSVTIQAIGIAGNGTAIQRITADSSFIEDGATTLITARVIDSFGDPVDSVTVTWSSSDGSLSAIQSITGSSGHAETGFTAPTTTGMSTVTATLPNRGSITFVVGHSP